MFFVQHPGIHAPAYQPAWGEGFEDAFRNVNVAKEEILLKLGINIGEKFPWQGAILQAVRFREAVQKGDWVKLKFGGADRLGTVTNGVAPTAKAIQSSFNLTRDDLVNVEKAVPGWLFITSGTGIGQRRRILANTGSTDTPANILTVSEPSWQLIGDTTGVDAFSTTPANGDGLSLVALWECIKTTSEYDLTQGVVMGDADSGNYGVICVAGPAMAKCIGSTEALVAHKGLVMSSTAGVARGRDVTPADAATALKEAEARVGWAFDAYSGAAALRHVWVSGEHAI